VMANSDQSVKCSSDTTICSSQSINCKPRPMMVAW
jgi:hypothetical protein